MRYLPLVALLSLGCISTTVTRLSLARYAARSSDVPIPLYSSQLPTCSFEEIALVKARGDNWGISTGVVDVMRKKARELGGDALVRVGFGDAGFVTATIIRFQRDDCRQ